MKYLWTEDTKAGFHYWQLVNKYLFDNSLTVESKENNQKLLDAVRELKPQEEDIYYIAFDIIYDNMDIMNKYMELQSLAAKNPEYIVLLDITCFEAVIFTFKHLVKWTGSGRKAKIAMREVILKAFKNHRIDIDSIEDSKTLNYLMGFKHYSTEKVLKSITNELTDKNEWSVKGERMGRCWHQDCCILENTSRIFCNVPDNMSGKDKMISLLTDDETQRIIQSINIKNI